MQERRGWVGVGEGVGEGVGDSEGVRVGEVEGVAEELVVGGRRSKVAEAVHRALCEGMMDGDSDDVVVEAVEGVESALMEKRGEDEAFVEGAANVGTADADVAPRALVFGLGESRALGVE